MAIESARSPKAGFAAPICCRRSVSAAAWGAVSWSVVFGAVEDWLEHAARSVSSAAAEHERTTEMRIRCPVPMVGQRFTSRQARGARCRRWLYLRCPALVTPLGAPTLTPRASRFAPLPFPVERAQIGIQGAAVAEHEA